MGCCGQAKLSGKAPFSQYAGLAERGASVVWGSPADPSCYPDGDFDVVYDNNGKDMEACQPLIDAHKARRSCVQRTAAASLTAEPPFSTALAHQRSPPWCVHRTAGQGGTLRLCRVCRGVQPQPHRADACGGRPAQELGGPRCRGEVPGRAGKSPCVTAAWCLRCRPLAPWWVQCLRRGGVVTLTVPVEACDSGSAGSSAVQSAAGALPVSTGRRCTQLGLWPAWVGECQRRAERAGCSGPCRTPQALITPLRA